MVCKETNKKVNAKRLIVVIGMHRSGTSAITRGLIAMGVALGNNLMQAIEGDNDKGFWEDNDIYSFNTELLHSINSEWHFLSPIKQSEFEQLRQSAYFQRAVDLINRKIGDHTIYGIKDPRIAKLLPFWKDVFSYCKLDVSYILALRHPLCVAQSLQKRNDIDIEKGYYLWLNHVIMSITYTINCDRIVMDYDLLLQSPKEELKKLAEHLILPIDLKELKIYLTEFLDNNHRHTYYRLSHLIKDDIAPKLLKEVYSTILDMAVGMVIADEKLQEKIVNWWQEISVLNPAFVIVDRQLLQIEAIKDKLAECYHQINILNHLFIEKERFIKEIEGSLNDKENSIKELEKFTHQQENIILNKESVIREQEIFIFEKESDLKQKDIMINTLKKTIQEKVSNETEKSKAIIALKASISWKITQPIRWFANLFSNLSNT